MAQSHSLQWFQSFGWRCEEAQKSELLAVLYGCIQFIILPYAIAPLQSVVGLPVGVWCLGVSWFFPKIPCLGAAVAVCKFCPELHFRCVNWAPIYAPDIDPYIYSSVYNGSYMVPELIITVFVVFLLQASKALRAYL